MPTPRVIAVAVRDESARHGLRRIDPEIRGNDMNPVRFGANPRKRRRHAPKMARLGGQFHPRAPALWVDASGAVAIDQVSAEPEATVGTIPLPSKP
jgi:hypothetical protein